MFVGELTFLMLGTGAFAAGATALVFHSWIAQLVVFTIVSVGMMFFVKPVLRRKMLSTATDLDTSPKALTGQMAKVVESVDGASGMIRLNGEYWSAHSLDPAQHYEEGDLVQVVRVDGATAVVWKEM